MNNIMLDLECLDSCTTAAIISIGAVYFDLEEQILGPELYIELSKYALMDQLSRGRTWSVDTNIWWMKQTTQAREVWSNTYEKRSNQGCLHDLLTFFNLFTGKKTVWGNGSTYDNICLRSYFECFDVNVPWEFKNDLCYRTIKVLFGNRAKVSRIGTHHNALDDAVNQAKHLMLINDLYSLNLQ